MRRVALALVVAGSALGACQREARSASYFEAHPGEIAGVLAACKAGSTRGGECDNAALADARRQASDRMNLYKKSF